MVNAIRNFRATGTGIMDIRKGMGHHDLTEILHEFAYKNGKTASVTIMYSGQMAKPIQLCCLRSRTSSNNDPGLRPLRVSLISMRHLRLDHIVDIAWIINKELSLDRTRVQQDDYCYNYTLEQLRQFAYKGVRHIHLYHTGYSIAIIGFYRALIKYLQEPAASLTVTPYYYDKAQSFYRKGSTWD